MTEKIAKPFIGASGVFFLCAELSRKGFIALPTVRNTKGIDIFAVSPKGRKISIQVKTRENASEWPVPMEDDIEPNDDYYFAFINLRSTLPPEYFFFTSKFVKEYTARAFKTWLAMPGRNEYPHDENNPIRKFPVSPSKVKKFGPWAHVDLGSHRDWDILK